MGHHHLAHRSRADPPPEDALPLPPPPPLGASRPERLVDRLKREAAGHSGRRSPPAAAGDGGSPKDLLPPPRPPFVADCAPTAPLPPPPPLGSSRPERLVDRLKREAGHRPSPPPAVADGSREDLPPLPPPPPLGSSRPERVVDRFPGHADVRTSPPPAANRSPKEPPPLALPPPSPVGSSRPDRLDDEGSARPAGRKRSASPCAEGGRGRRHRSPSLGSPAPEPPPAAKLSRRESSRSESERSGGTRSNSPAPGPDQPRSGYGATSSGRDNTEREGLMTYKQFIQALEDDVSPTEAGGRYQEYKTEYITNQKRAYFDLNKNEDWLKDKYHPTKLLSVIDRRNEFCKTVAKELILDLRTGSLDIGPGVNTAAASKSGNGNDGSSEDDTYYDRKKRVRGRRLRKEIEPFLAAPKAHPVTSQYRRIQADLDHTLALVKKLDSEKGIVGNILSTAYKPNVHKSHGASDGPAVIVQCLSSVKNLEGVELLDILLTYLWRVHGVDYYGMSEMKYAKGFRHIRGEDKSTSMPNIDADEWEQKLDSFWEKRLTSGEDPLVVLTAKRKIDAETVKVLEPYVRKVRDEKYVWTFGCGAKGCAKIFHAPEFVHKHLKLKHPNLISVLTSRVENDIYFQNDMNDPDAPGGIPVMQRPKPNTMKRRPDEKMPSASNAGPLLEFAPPPVLIPLPGAGPFGPFVPASREVAMQMLLRDQ